MIRAFPFDQLPKVRDLAVGNALARWAAAKPAGGKLEKLLGGPSTIRFITGALDDPHAAACELRIGGQGVIVRGASPFVRWLAQKLLSGPDEASAPRELTEAEAAIWVLFVATAVDDLNIRGEVWPTVAVPHAGSRFTVQGDLAGHPCTIELAIPPTLALVAPSVQASRLPTWADSATLTAPIIVGRCTLDRTDVAKLRVRSIITLDRPHGGNLAELELLHGAIGLATTADPLVVRVAEGYVPRAMALPDDARVELTVGLGTTTLSLRQTLSLAVGEVVPLGRPLAGPFEIRAAGTLIGQGELVDVDGELGVRIVSLAQE
ncbi:MAG TPA: FliM/FliN family flagellar motor switch protein [Kofleriaceae bacterium]